MTAKKSKPLTKAAYEKIGNIKLIAFFKRIITVLIGGIPFVFFENQSEIIP